MDIEAVLLINILLLLVGLLISYVVIRLAVFHAMRSHSVWVVQGGIDRVVAARAERDERNAAELAKHRQESQRQSEI
ncbi:hypothetical protein LJR045_002388 [Microbacterium sp. LjRoot45]|uniref:hypothetical protein n=1 Tax=Microbacterium sp. LjRoot45 TaxID=3342329 RepID=UPI003ECFF8F6